MATKCLFCGCPFGGQVSEEEAAELSQHCYKNPANAATTAAPGAMPKYTGERQVGDVVIYEERSSQLIAEVKIMSRREVRGLIWFDFQVLKVIRKSRHPHQPYHSVATTATSEAFQASDEVSDWRFVDKPAGS